MENIKHLALDYSELSGQILHAKRPVKLERGGLFLCQRGHADIVIDLKRFHIKVGDLVSVFPYSIVQILNHSADFNGNILAADVSFFASIQVSDRPSYYLHIKENPCISLLKKEWKKIVSLHKMLLREKANTGHPLRREIDECLMKMIAYEVAAIYIKRRPILQQARSRSEEIFEQFIFLLFNSCHSRRTLEYYAFQQSITPRHLSRIVKQMSGITAGEWIITCTLANIKSKLQDHKRSIAQISEEMNFPNPSFFSQYFKKYAGISPKEYRKGIYS